MTNKKPQGKLGRTNQVASLVDKLVMWMFALGVLIVISLFVYVLINEFASKA